MQIQSSKSSYFPTGSSTGVIILAAGAGKRMRSSLPKVLHTVGGLPMLAHVLGAVHAGAPHAEIGVVIGHEREKVKVGLRSWLERHGILVTWIEQDQQLGTGHAARIAIESPLGQRWVSKRAQILVLPGDLPLITPELVAQMVAPLPTQTAMRLLTCELTDPTGYGRVVRRGKSGAILRIVEEKDANLREKSIREAAVSIYQFQSAFMKYALARVSNRNAQGEYYLTDLVSHAVRAKKRIEPLLWPSEQELRGVNDPWELCQAGLLLNERIIRHWSKEGVRFWDPRSTWIGTEVRFETEVEVQPGSMVTGRTDIGKGCVIGPNCMIDSSALGENVQVKTGTIIESSQVRDHAVLGPYARLRPDSDVGTKAKIGNFVELKKAKIGSATSVAHLSYIGDAEIGQNVNVGCGFITCNYDGNKKNLTVIEDGAFIGSDCQAVAPVRIGKGAYIASGSTITDTVEPGSLAIARARQVNKSGYAARLRNDQKKG